jgi:hypothetical protein
MEEKMTVPPNTKERFAEGVRRIFPANSGGPAFAPPPQANRVQQRNITVAEDRPNQRNLPMHSSSNLAVILP